MPDTLAPLDPPAVTPPPAVAEVVADDGFESYYPGIHNDEDVATRVRLMQWVPDGLEAMGVWPDGRSWVLATDHGGVNRILAYGPDTAALRKQVYTAEPELLNARVVYYWISPPTTGWRWDA